MDDKVVTIQKTSKKIKAQLAISILLVVLGFKGIAEHGGEAQYYLMLFGGAIWHVCARVSRWWNHG